MTTMIMTSLRRFGPVVVEKVPEQGWTRFRWCQWSLSMTSRDSVSLHMARWREIDLVHESPDGLEMSFTIRRVPWRNQGK